jgi:hypothetical protein
MSLNSFYGEKYFGKPLYRKSKHTFCVQKLFFRNRASYEKMWKNMVERDRPHMAM